MSKYLRIIGFELWYWLGYKLDVKLEHMGVITGTPVEEPPAQVVYQENPELQTALARVVHENDELKAEVASLKETNQRLAKNPTGTGRPNARKLNKREVSLVYEYHRAGWTNAAIARSFDVNPATISRIVRGQYHKGKK